MKFKSICLIATLLAASCAAQTPQIKNAKLQHIAAQGNLQSQVSALAGAQPATSWIGYTVASVPSHHSICCSNGDWSDAGRCCGSCRLSSEGSSGFQNDCDDIENKAVTLLFRADAGKIDSIRIFTQNCTLDAAGAPVTLIDNVDPKQSVAYLATFVSKDDSSSLGRRALDAISEHADASADDALDHFASASDYPEKIREHAAFWLGVNRGAHGYATLKRLIESDPNDRLREKLTFALSQSREAQAQDELIRVAKQDASSRVRGQALFWLAQKAGKRVAGVITDAVENDPDTDVKKKAVFALSQMPDHEGVPKLIEVARTNRNPVVRKQAVFWLGQSDDPRALNFITEVLTGEHAQ